MKTDGRGGACGRVCLAALTLWLLLGILGSSLMQASTSPILPRPRDAQYLQEDLARLAKSPHDPVLLREAAISYNVVGAPDNWDYLRKAQAMLDEANRLRPDDPFTLMFMGSTLGLLARHPDVSIFSRASMAAESLDLMDRAVVLDPNNYRLRLIRGTSGIAVPSFLGRGDKLDEDAAYVRKTLEPAPPTEYPPYLQAAGFLLLGTYHEKKDELTTAETYWRKAIQLGKGTRYEREAHKKLQAHGRK